MGLVLFEKPLRWDKKKAGYEKKVWIYAPDFYTGTRYLLGKWGSKLLITVGINPSTAEPDKMDNTMKSVERIVFGNGFDAYCMFNVYPQRTTDPNQMHDTFHPKWHQENMRAFCWLLEESGPEPAIWAAWGTLIEKRPYLKGCLQEMIDISKKYNASWYRVGKETKKGHPHHPLYLKKDSKIEVFDIENYSKNILETKKQAF